MKSGRIIAVCGKGGTGKTTLAALFARLTLERGKIKALFIDADPTGGLTMALSLPVKRTLNDLRCEVSAEFMDKPVDARSLAAAADYRLLESITEHENIAFLAVGRPEEEGCFCPVNTLLRRSIEMLAARFDLTVIDAEAGIEQVNRRVIGAVDRLYLLSDLSRKGLQVAQTVYDVTAAFGGFREAGLVINRLRPGEAIKSAPGLTSLPLWGTLPEDETVRRFDREGISILGIPPCPSLTAAAGLLSRQ